MKSYGYAALVLLLAVLVVGLASGVFTQAPGPRISTPPSDTDSIAAFAEPDERHADPAAAGALLGQDEAGSREGGSDISQAQRLTAPQPPVRDAVPAYPEVDPRPEHQETVLGGLLFVIRDDRELPLSGVLIRLRSESGEQTAFTGSGAPGFCPGPPPVPGSLGS